jgi:hypothetical protein
MAETVKPKGKKKKKAPKKADTLFSKGGTSKFEESNFQESPERSPEPSPTRNLNQADTMLVVDDMDATTVKTKKSKKSAASKGLKRKTTKSKDKKKHIDEAPEVEIVVNNVNFAGFGQKQATMLSPKAEEKSIALEEPVVEEQRSKKSKKGKKSSKRGSRSSSAQRQRGSQSGDEEGAGGPKDDDLRPDFEAEEVGKKSKFNGGDNHGRVNKADLFKPVSQLEREK